MDYERTQLVVGAILEEAKHYEIQEQVWITAQQELRTNPTIDVVEAYQTAFQDAYDERNNSEISH